MKKHKNIINLFNNKFALYLTLGVSSVWAFYAFVIFGLTPLFWPHYENNIMYWSNFLQLIFLPVITVGSNILGKKAERRSIQDHKRILHEFTELKQMHMELKVLIKNYGGKDKETEITISD
jgi:hypothetical protein